MINVLVVILVQAKVSCNSRNLCCACWKWRSYWNNSSSAAVLAASSDQSDKAASTATDDDLISIKTCTDPCGPNWSDEAARTAADDDLTIETSNTSIALYKHFLLVVINYFRQGNFYEYKISVNGCEALINFLNALSVTVSLVFSWLEFR